MGPLSSAALAAAILLAHPAAAGVAAECVSDAHEADEAGLLQRSTGAKARGAGNRGTQSAGVRAAADAETAAMPESALGATGHPSNTILEYSPDDITSALEMGTDANIGANDPSFSKAVMDLTGIWYLKWRANGSPAVRAYRRARTEIAVTFAGTSVLGYTGPDGPFTLKMPGQKRQHWAYSDSGPALGQMLVHALAWYHCSDGTFEMESNRVGELDGIGPFRYLNEDQWERPTPTLAGTYTYNLSRIVYANGSRTEHYAHYAKLMDGYKLRVWGNNNQLARCKATASSSYVCSALIDHGYCEL